MAASSRRARVMSRSQKLGHCICDPRKPCPCDLLLERDVCLCAGERLEEEAAAATDAIRLTKLVKNAGCASKIPPADLARILARLPKITDPRLLVGSASADDAGIVKVSDDLCLVQTVDVFTPSVDDSYTFGRIAACNSLSDVYAMGGRPVCALSIIGYPIHTQKDEWMFQMLKGGMDALSEAGVLLAGGHSINDEEIKFGFAVTGVIEADKIITNAGAQVGDALILTKPLGTGIIAFADQMGKASEVARQAAAGTMTALNAAASEIMAEAGAHACTDVTGFGLLGHLYHVVRESGVTAQVGWGSIPLLPEVEAYAQAGMVSGAAERNREFASAVVEAGEDVPEYGMDILYDPQTSGGLLFAVAAARAPEVLAKLHAAGCAEAALVGRITEKSAGQIEIIPEAEAADKFVTGKESRMKEAQENRAIENKEPLQAQSEEEACCAGEPGEETSGAAGTPQAAFQQFMAAAFRPGALDVIQKELITIALSVALQCKDCLDIHLKKAQAMGISPEEIEEAAWLGVVFGGCKAMMFWREFGKSTGTN